MRSALKTQLLFAELLFPLWFVPKTFPDSLQLPSLHNWRIKYLQLKQEDFYSFLLFSFFFPLKTLKDQKSQAGMEENRENPNISRVVAAEHWSTNCDFSGGSRQQNSTLLWPGWTEGKRENPDTNPQKHFRQKLFLLPQEQGYSKKKSPRLFLEGFTV